MEALARAIPSGGFSGEIRNIQMDLNRLQELRPRITKGTPTKQDVFDFKTIVERIAKFEPTPGILAMVYFAAALDALISTLDEATSK